MPVHLQPSHAPIAPPISAPKIAIPPSQMRKFAQMSLSSPN
jgi:hypothetical protein